MADSESEPLLKDGQPISPKVSSSGSLDRLVVPIIILLHVAITVFLAIKLNIWVDEAFSLHTSERGFGYALSQALNFELQAPLYFVILSIWRKIDSSIVFARLLSIAYVALSLHFVAALSKRFWNELHPGWIVAIVAFNPLTIAVAVDVRLYAQVRLVTVLLLLTFYDGFLKQATSRRAQVGYVLLAVAALYTQYYMGFLLVGNAIALLVLRRWRPLLQYLIGMAVVAICFSPMAPFIRYQMSAHTTPIRHPKAWIEVLKDITWRIKDYLLPVGWDITLVVRSWVLRICYLVAFYILIRMRKKLSTELIAMWTTSFVVAFCFLMIARSSGETLLQTRHTAVLFIPINFAVFSIFKLARDRRVLICWTALVLIFALTGLYFFAKPMAKPGDWKRVGAYLMANEHVDEPILVFHGGAALPLAHYYVGSNSLVPVPRPNTFERFEFQDYVIRDEREISAALKRVPGDHERIWLVTDGECTFGDLKYNCETLEGFINNNYILLESKNFRNATVRRLRRVKEF